MQLCQVFSRSTLPPFLSFFSTLIYTLITGPHVPQLLGWFSHRELQGQDIWPRHSFLQLPPCKVTSCWLCPFNQKLPLISRQPTPYSRIQGTTLSPIPSSLQILTIWLQVTTLPLQVPHLYKVPLKNKASSNYPISSVPTVSCLGPCVMRSQDDNSDNDVRL